MYCSSVCRAQPTANIIWIYSPNIIDSSLINYNTNHQGFIYISQVKHPGYTVEQSPVSIAPVLVENESHLCYCKAPIISFRKRFRTVKTLFISVSFARLRKWFEKQFKKVFMPPHFLHVCTIHESRIDLYELI
jgi:hypothetical protein